MATEHGIFEVVDVDLAAVALPFLHEPHHPKLGHYVHKHTKQWSATVAHADAFVFVTPEYNYGYGGIGAGTRAIQQLKQVVTTLRMVPVFEAVNIPFAAGTAGSAMPSKWRRSPRSGTVRAATPYKSATAETPAEPRPSTPPRVRSSPSGAAERASCRSSLVLRRSQSGTLAPPRVGASPRTPASATGCAPRHHPALRETEPEELKKNEPVTAQQGPSQ
ncbi:MAG: NAD(P)H-dependent oxidoreductase [Trebonia sp.]